MLAISKLIVSSTSNTRKGINNCKLQAEYHFSPSPHTQDPLQIFIKSVELLHNNSISFFFLLSITYGLILPIFHGI